MKFNLMGMLQRIGKSLMTPIAVLPAAALLLRLGELIKSLTHDHTIINTAGFVMMKSGGAIFENLPLIFAIGVATGLTSDTGVAGLASVAGYLVMTKTIESIHPPPSPGMPSPVDMGVLGGLIIGLVAASLYERYNKIRLPRFLGFFGGKRFVPIITSFSALFIGLLAGIIWPFIQKAIDLAGNWMISIGPAGVFIYGLANRLLIPFGLHHILNTFVWFNFGSFTDSTGKLIHGDLNRFAAGDPSAGTFMSGYYPIMMFALPAVCIAMVSEAKPSRRKEVAGILIGSALTSLLTGITEPIEFSFMFLAPALYGIHAFLTGTSMAICSLLGIKMGFSFSAGLIDYILFFGKGTRPLLIIPVGLIYAVLYYVIFRFIIRRFNLTTQGREEDDDCE